MSRFWFKPKTHGYGAAPVTWQGWTLTLGYGATTILLSLLAFAGTPGAPPTTVAQWLVWAVLLAIITYGFLRLVRARTDGTWAWRWGSGEARRGE